MDYVRQRQGAWAGGLTGGLAVLVLSVFTLTTLMVLPQRVADIIWSNPANQSLPHPTPDDITMSVSDAVIRYLGFVIVGPLVGTACGLVGALIAGRLRKPQPMAMKAGAL